VQTKRIFEAAKADVDPVLLQPFHRPRSSGEEQFPPSLHVKSSVRVVEMPFCEGVAEAYEAPHQVLEWGHGIRHKTLPASCLDIRLDLEIKRAKCNRQQEVEVCDDGELAFLREDWEFQDELSGDPAR
jgi:hypothetical protein